MSALSVLIKLRNVLFLLSCCAFYFLTNVIFSLLISDSILAGFVSYFVLIFCFGLFAFRTPDVLHRDDSVSFSLFGWFLIFLVFGLLYVTSEAFGNYLYTVCPIGLTDTYVSMEGDALYAYLIAGCTVAPVTEELLFRRILFSGFRRSFSFWPSVIFSGILFSLFHGTVMHIPIAIGLSVFLSILYETTGRFTWCIVFHVLFNCAAVLYLVSVQIPSVIMILFYFLVLAVLVLSYQFRSFVFGRLLRRGCLSSFEAYLDEKRRHF